MKFMNIIHFDELDSTNTYAKLHIEELPDKSVISTNIQAKGRGRFTRSWVDLGSENIFMSFILKPSDALQPVYSNLTQYLSVVLCKQLESLMICPPPQPAPSRGAGDSSHSQLDVKIKWPNDVLLNGKKVCGILAESVIKQGKLKGIVLGIGINLNANQDDLNNIDIPATALNIEIGNPVNKKEFMEKLVENFFAGYEEFLNSGFINIKHDYENKSFIKEKAIVKVGVFDKIKEGVFHGFDNDGALILINKSGVPEKFNMGEIVLME